VYVNAVVSPGDESTNQPEHPGAFHQEYHQEELLISL